MTDRTLKTKVDKLQEVNTQIAMMEKQADKLKADIQAEMNSRAVDEIQAGNALVRWKVVNSTRFDTKAFKQAHSSLYSEFAKPSTTRRFTVVPA